MRFLCTLALFALSLTVSLPAFAGGFYVETFSPNSSARSASKSAFVLARLVGCHQPERGGVKATAYGMVNGKREVREAKVIPLKTQGMFVIERTWPASGQWVLQLDGTHPDIEKPTVLLLNASSEEYTTGTKKVALGFTTPAQIESEIRSLLE